jgi:hypothetical protein
LPFADFGDLRRQLKAARTRAQNAAENEKLAWACVSEVLS